MSVLAKHIIYAVHKMNKEEIQIGKTIIQKIMYFNFFNSKDVVTFIPYLYGPYSEDVQSLMKNMIRYEYLKFNDRFYLTVNEEKINNSNKSTNDEYATLDLIVDFLKKNKITATKEISNLAKVFMFKEHNPNSVPPNLIKLILDKSKYIGWTELSKKSDDYINEKVKHVESLRNYLL